MAGAAALLMLLLVLTVPEQAAADGDPTITLTLSNSDSRRLEYTVRSSEALDLLVLRAPYDGTINTMLDALRNDPEQAYTDGNELARKLLTYDSDTDQWDLDRTGQEVKTVSGCAVSVVYVSSKYAISGVDVYCGDVTPDTKIAVVALAVKDGKPLNASDIYMTPKEPTVVTTPTPTLVYGNTKAAAKLTGAGVVTDENGDALEGSWEIVMNQSSDKLEMNKYVTWEVKFTPDNTDYGTVSEHVPVAYEKKPITVTVSDATVSYGGALPTADALVTIPSDALVTGKSYADPDDTVATVTDALSVVWSDAMGQKPSAGSYTFTLASASEKYDITFQYANGQSAGSCTVTTVPYTPATSSADRQYDKRKNVSATIALTDYLPQDGGALTDCVISTSGAIAYLTEPTVDRTAKTLSFVLDEGAVGDTGSIRLTLTTTNYSAYDFTINITRTETQSSSSSYSSSSSSGSSEKPAGSQETSGKHDWAAVCEHLRALEDGAEYTIVLNGATCIPGNVLEAIRGRDVRLRLEYPSGAALILNGKELTYLRLDEGKDYSICLLWLVTRLFV